VARATLEEPHALYSAVVLPDRRVVDHTDPAACTRGVRRHTLFSAAAHQLPLGARRLGGGCGSAGTHSPGAMPSTGPKNATWPAWPSTTTRSPISIAGAGHVRPPPRRSARLGPGQNAGFDTARTTKRLELLMRAHATPLRRQCAAQRSGLVRPRAGILRVALSGRDPSPTLARRTGANQGISDDGINTDFGPDTPLDCYVGLVDSNRFFTRSHDFEPHFSRILMDMAGLVHVAATPIWSNNGVHFVETNTVACAHTQWSFGENDFSTMAERCMLKTVWNEPCGKKRKVQRNIIDFEVGQAKVRLFQSGKMLCLAAPTEEQACAALQLVVEDIRSIGSEPIGFTPPKVENIFGTVALGYKVGLDSLVEHLNNLVEGQAAMQQTKNRCVQYKQRVQNNREVTLRIFSTGKIVLMGARTKDDVRTVLDTVQLALQHARLHP
jgi:TATA-box binding protein (TBP) (component of TFIID and TFIIIB)